MEALDDLFLNYLSGPLIYMTSTCSGRPFWDSGARHQNMACNMVPESN